MRRVGARGRCASLDCPRDLCGDRLSSAAPLRLAKCPHARLVAQIGEARTKLLQLLHDLVTRLAARLSISRLESDIFFHHRAIARILPRLQLLRIDREHFPRTHTPVGGPRC